MNIERVLYFIFKYNILIIELLFAVSLIGVLLLAFRFFTTKDESLTGSPDWNKLEDNIKKILENANHAPVRGEAAMSQGVGHVEIPEGLSESVFIQELQTQLERTQIQLLQKDEEIKKLNEIASVNSGLPTDIAAPASAPTPTPTSGGADVSAYEEKIKDLESRLNEYSIIEDDIADLSFYKEETVRLQSEVDKLTAELAALKEAEERAPKATVVAAAAEPDVAPAASIAPPDPVAAIPEPAPVAVPEPAAPAAASTDFDFIDNDIMAEFERAVAEQKAVTEAAKQAKAESKKAAQAKAVDESAQTVSPAPAASSLSQNMSSNEPSDTATVDPTAGIDFSPTAPINPDAANAPAVIAETGSVEEADVLAVNAKAENEASKNAAAVVESENKIPEGDINIDKMLNEAQGLSASDQAEEVPNAIDSTLDTDKLLQEASGMGNIDTEALNEFGDFIKKEGA